MPEKSTGARAKANSRAGKSPSTAAGDTTARSGATKAKAPGKPADKLEEYRRKRDFSRTAEPKGGSAASKQKLGFVIQKHAASHLHYDLRLELDGVMKSWAVPKGPSLDPAVRRLAMQVEDHPIEYNKFEGTIPQGEYGGGTDPDPIEGLRRGYAKGDLKFVLNGKRLKGSWVLVRMRRDSPGKAQWLLIKHRDEHAVPGSDVTAENETSVATGRTMDEIATGRSRVWRSNRPVEPKGLKLLRALQTSRSGPTTKV